MVLHPDVDEQDLDADQPAVGAAARALLERVVLLVAGDPDAAAPTAVRLHAQAEQIGVGGAGRERDRKERE